MARGGFSPLKHPGKHLYLGLMYVVTTLIHEHNILTQQVHCFANLPLAEIALCEYRLWRSVTVSAFFPIYDFSTRNTRFIFVRVIVLQ